MGIIFPIIEGVSKPVKVVTIAPEGYTLVNITDQAYSDYDFYRSHNDFIAVKK